MTQREIIPEGDFATGNQWTANSPWQITGGVATIDGSQGGAVTLALEDQPELRGKLLVITFEITRSAGGVTLKCGATAGTQRVLTGTYTERLLMLGGDDIVFEADASFNGTIDNVTGYVDTDETSPEISGGDTAGESSDDSVREYTLPADVY